MSEILTFTKKAKSRLKEIMSTSNHKDTLGLRISVTAGGCAGMTYKMDYVQKRTDGDEMINIDDIYIFIDPRAIMYILGTKMDYREDKLSSRFVFDNPNEKSTCGCGESFSI